MEYAQNEQCDHYDDQDRGSDVLYPFDLVDTVVCNPCYEQHEDHITDELSACYRFLYAAPGRKTDRPAFVSKLRNECTDHSADSAAAYPCLYGSPSAGCDRSQQSRDLCTQCSECQSCEQRERNPVFCTDLRVQLDRDQDEDVT